MSAMQCGNIWAPKEVSLFTLTNETLIALTALTGNLLIIVIITKDPLKKLHTPFNYFIVNLAVADFLVGIVMAISIYIHTLEYKRELDNIGAKFILISLFVSITASIFNLIILSIDRYVAITFPMKYRSYFSWFRCWIITGVMWLFSLSLPFTYFQVGFIDYLMVYANAGVGVALIITIFTYSRIYIFLRKHTHQIKEQLRTSSIAVKEYTLKRLLVEKKITRVFLVVLVLFIMTYVPSTIMIYILKFCKKCNCVTQHWLRDLSILLVALNSCMNPFVYALRLKPFKEALKHYYFFARRKKGEVGNSSTTVVYTK